MRELQQLLDVSQQCCINAFCSRQAGTVQAGKALTDNGEEPLTGTAYLSYRGYRLQDINYQQKRAVELLGKKSYK